ncbi:MAG: hypothetical protein DME23_22195 [Verrucomicrobia bacterium]|nr:MAG: hypothetical protein DME23_22195 [Verrucomicrobiota bacterium]
MEPSNRALVTASRSFAIRFRELPLLRLIVIQYLLYFSRFGLLHETISFRSLIRSRPLRSFQLAAKRRELSGTRLEMRRDNADCC